MVSSALFPHRIGRGYSTQQLRVVKDVNGTPSKNLAHLVEVLRDGTDEFVIFNFHERQTQAIVLRRAEVAAATEEILSDNGIRAQASSELLAIWGASKKSQTGERTTASVPEPGVDHCIGKKAPHPTACHRGTFNRCHRRYQS